MPISDIKPKFFEIEPSEVYGTTGFLTYEDAGKTYDEAGYTFDGIAGNAGKPPVL